VRSIERVKIYSVTKEHRDRFAEEMTELLNVEVQPVSSPEAVLRGSDIVLCATNASQPVFDGNWLASEFFLNRLPEFLLSQTVRAKTFHEIFDANS
jgi:ornithine cyclodeaminase/alanine dehydrogenase-like protein (mu-crystallin family)